MASITRSFGIGTILWALGMVPACAQYGDKAYAPPPANPAAAPQTQQPMVRQPALVQPAAKEAKQSGKLTVNELPTLAPQLISSPAQTQRVAPVAANAPRDMTAENKKAAAGGAGQEAKAPRGRASVSANMQPAGYLTPSYLNETSNYLLPPLEPAPAQGRMPILSREPTLLGAVYVREPQEPQAGDQAYGLTLNALPLLALGSLELKVLKLDEAKIVDLSLPILDLTQTQDALNGGSFGTGFLPYRLLPWPGVSTHTAAPTTGAQQAGGYNPFLAASGLGNIGAIGNIANTIGNLTGAGNIGAIGAMGNVGAIGNIGNIGNLGGYGLPALPRY